MKWTMLLIVFCLLSIAAVSTSSAAVYLVCAPQSNVDRYEIERNGTVVMTSQSPDPSGTYGFKHDVTSLADGTYTYRAKACNLWGCSDFSSPLVFTKALPGAPQGLMLLGE